MYRWFVALLCVCASLGTAAPSSGEDSFAVEVVFQGRVAEALDRINRLEKRREVYVRKYRSERKSRGIPKLTKSYYSKAEFGSERLIPELDDFSFETVIERAIRSDLRAMGVDALPAKVKVTIEDMRIVRYSLVQFQSLNNVMIGTVETLDEKGKRTGGIKLKWQMVPRYVNDRAYSGPDYAFLKDSAFVRVAPLAVGFVGKALEQLYPGHRAPEPIFILPPKGIAR